MQPYRSIMISKLGIPMADTSMNNDPSRERLRRHVEEILQRFDDLPTLDLANTEEILGYAENGLPGEEQG
jgi:hypothetical protein